MKNIQRGRRCGTPAKKLNYGTIAERFLEEKYHMRNEQAYSESDMKTLTEWQLKDGLTRLFTDAHKRFLEDEKYHMRMHEQAYSESDMEDFDRMAIERWTHRAFYRRS